MEYPVSGSISIGRFHATSEEDLVALYEHIQMTHGLEYAIELGDLYPEVFTKMYDVRLTQGQLDLLHLLLGHVSSREGFILDEVIAPFVSEAAYENYDRVSWSVTSEDGLNIKIN